MKKIVALVSSLLIFSGLKAQTTQPVKKETVKPVMPISTGTADSLKSVKGNTSLKLSAPGTADSLKALKTGVMVKPTTTLPVKVPVVKPDKY